MIYEKITYSVLSYANYSYKEIKVITWLLTVLMTVTEKYIGESSICLEKADSQSLFAFFKEKLSNPVAALGIFWTKDILEISM